MSDDPNKKKQDAKEIAAKEKYEIEYMKTKHGVPENVTIQIIAKVGHSREKIYAELRKKGYNL